MEQPGSFAGGDRLGKLEDRVLGNILSFLPAKEAARGALLSSRWRHVFAAVHTISLEEPETPITDPADEGDRCIYCRRGPSPDPSAPPPFSSAVSTAIIARHRRRGAAPLRALRIAMETHRAGDSSMLDQWVSYAVQQADPRGLHLDLRLSCRLYHCQNRYTLRTSPTVDVGTSDDDEHKFFHHIHGQVCNPTVDVGPSDDDEHEFFHHTHEQVGNPTVDVGPSDDDEHGFFHHIHGQVGNPTVDDGPSDDDEPEFFHHIHGQVGNPTVDVGFDIDMVDNPPPRKPGSTDNVGSGSSDDSSVVSSDDDERALRYQPPWLTAPLDYNVPAALFTCAELRSLSLGSCRVAPPATARLPSLVTLLLSHVADAGADVERLIAGCPRLADLTLEACDAVTALSVIGGARLRRLALRCCHELVTVAIDSSELRAFEYRGVVPDSASFLTMHGGFGRIAYCKVDICGAEATSEVELINLRQFLQLFANAKHMHLESARLGSGFDKDVPEMFSVFSNLRHLEMRGCLPDDDTGVIGAMNRILERTPNLEALSLAFHPDKFALFREDELMDPHPLRYNRHWVLAVPNARIPCLTSRLKEINLVHYHGGTAQRALAKFLLCNAPAIDKLWCDFAEGPMWTQIQLMREIGDWLINKSANIHFA